MKSLVVTEKPSIARDIAQILECGKNINGAIEGERYVVTWRLGHLVILAGPEDYDKKYKEWEMEDLPTTPEVFKSEVIKQTSKQYQAIKDQTYREDAGDIIIAMGAGKEGGLVARLILKETGCNKPIRRLWISSVTDKVIGEGFANLKDRRECNNLYDATMYRTETDWLVDISATRALTYKYDAQLSCGCVQTPTLAMTTKREVQICVFMPYPYFGLQAKRDELVLTRQDARTGGRRPSERGRMEELTKGLKGEPAAMTEVKRASKETLPPLLYDLAELQRDANKRFNCSAKDMLNIMQSLYESHKVLTYLRTDFRYLSTDIVPTLKERLKVYSIGPYKTLAGRLMNQLLPPEPFFADDSKMSNHHAIIPTKQFVQIDYMTIGKRRIYDLVVRRFLTVPYPPFEHDKTSLEVGIGRQRFTTKGRIVESQGWKAACDTVMDDGEEGKKGDESEVRDQQLPDLKKGDVLKGLSVKMTEDKTKLPAPSNEATLLSAMESPVAYMETKNKAMAKTLGGTGSLGTAAIRANIIEKLFSGFPLEERGKGIYPTPKARQLLELVPEDLKKPELTADWEMELSSITKGSLERDTFMRDIGGYSQELIRQIKTGEGSFRHDNLISTEYSACGKRMLAVEGENAGVLVCQDRERSHREVISRTSSTRCPICHEKMELKGKGDAQISVRRCGHKGELKAFQKRRKKEGTGVPRKDVARYLNQRKKEAGESVSNAFAKALAGIDLKDKG